MCLVVAGTTEVTRPGWSRTCDLLLPGCKTISLLRPVAKSSFGDVFHGIYAPPTKWASGHGGQAGLRGRTYLVFEDGGAILTCCRSHVWCPFAPGCGAHNGIYPEFRRAVRRTEFVWRILVGPGVQSARSACEIVMLRANVLLSSA